MYVKVFSVMSGVSKTRLLVQHEPFECKCILNETVIHSKMES